MMSTSNEPEVSKLEKKTAPSQLTTSVRRTRQALRDALRPVWPTSTEAPSAAMFSRIRNRLIFWYIGILAAILLLVGILLYVGMQNVLFSDVNSRLAQAASAAGFAWQQEEIRHPGDSCMDPTVQINFANSTANLAVPYLTCFDTHANALAQDTPYPPNLQDYYQSFLIDPSLARSALTNGTNAATDRIEIDGIGMVQRYAKVVTARDGTTLVIEVGMPIEGQVDALDTLFKLLLVFGVLTILGATAGGIFLAQRALAPAHLAFERQQSFIADAAHELRTPLTLLRANAEVLLRGRERLDPDDVYLLEDIVAESAHMGALANNLLTLARLDAGKQTTKRDVLDLTEIVTNITRQAGALADERKVSLQLVTPAEPALTLGDETLLKEATLILLDNAIKYNKSNGSVIVQVESNAKQVTLRVKDTGIGISEEHLARLGERFYRPDKARSREMGGAGLGLSIARGIAAAHDGTLTLTSVYHEGTTATLSLPAAEDMSREE